MKKLKKFEIIRRLGQFPLFSFNEFVRITGMSSEYARIYLFRLKKEGFIFQIERGKYSVYDDPMIFSSFIKTPSYISFWTAFRFYNFTEQLPFDVMIAVPRARKTIVFQGANIRFFKTKYFWGYRKQRYRNFDIFVAEKEKCILDVFLLKNTPFDEIIKAILTKDFDFMKLIEYSIRAKNKSLIKRIGYVMDHLGYDTKLLLKFVDNNYVLLDWNGTKKGKKIKRWKIIANRGLDDIA